MELIFTIVLILNIGVALPEDGSLGNTERNAIEDVVHTLGLSQRDLGFEKKWATDSIFRLKVVESLLDDPLRAPDYADRITKLTDALHNSIPAECCIMAEAIGVKLSVIDTLNILKDIEAEVSHLPRREFPPEIARAISFILASFEVGEKYLQEALQGVSERELEKLLIQAPVLWSDEDDFTDDYLKGELHREYGIEVDTSQKIENDTILQIAKKIDREALVLCGLSVLFGVDLAKKELARLNPSIMRGLRTEKFESRWGKVGIGSLGNDEWIGDFSIIIELGGNDNYSGRTGGAVGILGSPFSVLIDLSGDDMYSSDRLFNLGCAIFGCGVIVDLSGDDTYRGAHYSEGVGLFGTGFLWEGGGNDTYTAGYFAQGGGNFGLGGLIDCGGDDFYRSYNWAQGIGSVWGYGMLSDLGGNDVYYAGGRYFHRPLLPGDHRSFAQGFGMGWRPDASGGIGLLYDKGGNDFYCAQVYAQGSSYWYSLGILVDQSGNDYYNAAEYAQGAGIHLSLGVLIDRDGDDHYFSRYGPGQGEGHDLSCGILIDKEGDDSYMISGGQGIGLNNSVGILIDSEGKDHYSTKEAGVGQGSANLARGFGGIGIFLDLEGDDVYPKINRGEDGNFWTSGMWGAGVDLPVEQPEEEEQLEPDTLLESVEEIFEEASGWEVGENKKRVRWARERLIELGMEAVDYVCEEKIATKSGLELRAIRELAKEMPDSILPCLLELLEDLRPRARANSIWLLGKIKAKEAIPPLIEALKKPDNKPRWILRALGDIGERNPLPKIYPYLNDGDETARIAAASALGKIGAPESVPRLLEVLNDELFTVRSAAENALVSIGDSSITFILEALTNAKSPGVVHMIHALGRIGEQLDTLEARAERIRIKKALLPFLDSEENSLRGYAVEALARLGGEATLDLLRMRMADELDPFVLGKYRAIVD